MPKTLAEWVGKALEQRAVADVIKVNEVLGSSGTAKEKIPYGLRYKRKNGEITVVEDKEGKEYVFIWLRGKGERMAKPFYYRTYFLSLGKSRLKRRRLGYY